MKLFNKKNIRKSWFYTIKSINKVSPVTATRMLHYRTTGEILNLKNPSKFNDKLQWLKLYWQDPLVPLCADKYEIYNYVKENGDSSILNNLLAVYEDANEIDWENLPEKFALKCTHGCGYNIVTNNKYELNPKEVKRKLNTWLNEKFGEKSLEFHYDKIKPRIILEEYIENDAGLLPIDYKIYCFNGEPKLVLVCSERADDIKKDFFDLNWNRLNIGHKEDESKQEIKMPDSFKEMISHAAILAKPFPFVRVDFYDKEGKVVLGELTFTPAANMGNTLNEYGQKYLGQMLKLPSKKYS